MFLKHKWRGAVSSRWTIQLNSWGLLLNKDLRMRFWDTHTDQQTWLWTSSKQKNANWRIKVKPLFSRTLFHKAYFMETGISLFLLLISWTCICLHLKKSSNSARMAKLGQLCWSAPGLFPSHPSIALFPARGPSLLQHCQSRLVEALGSGACLCRGKAGVWPLPLTSKLISGQMTVREWACHLAACFRFQAHAECESRLTESPVVAYLATQDELLPCLPLSGAWRAAGLLVGEGTLWREQVSALLVRQQVQPAGGGFTRLLMR